MTGVNLITFATPKAGRLRAVEWEVWEQLLYTVHHTAFDVTYGIRTF